MPSCNLFCRVTESIIFTLDTFQRATVTETRKALIIFSIAIQKIISIIIRDFLLQTLNDLLMHNKDVSEYNRKAF